MRSLKSIVTPADTNITLIYSFEKLGTSHFFFADV